MAKNVIILCLICLIISLIGAIGIEKAQNKAKMTGKQFSELLKEGLKEERMVIVSEDLLLRAIRNELVVNAARQINRQRAAELAMTDPNEW